MSQLGFVSNFPNDHREFRKTSQKWMSLWLHWIRGPCLESTYSPYFFNYVGEALFFGIFTWVRFSFPWHSVGVDAKYRSNSSDAGPGVSAHMIISSLLSHGGFLSDTFKKIIISSNTWVLTLEYLFNIMLLILIPKWYVSFAKIQQLWEAVIISQQSPYTTEIHTWLQ